MGLVDYSDSESSDNEQVSESKKPTKGTFQKVVDRSNPGKIKVSLPTTAPINDEPPAKRAKTSGGGAFGGFNSFLPAPKKTGAAAPKTLGGGASGSGRGGGLGSGVSLKTGAAPAFSRNPEPVYDNKDDYDGHEESKGGESSIGLPPPSSSAQIPAAEVKLVGKPLMFKPLSVARKPQKKKKPVIIPKLEDDMASQGPSATTSEALNAPKAKVSLFSMPQDTDDDIAPKPKGEYQPMLYGAKPEEEGEPEVAQNRYYEDQFNDAESHHTIPRLAAQAPPPASTTSNSLNDIASDLQLSASERRQLFGRQGARNITASKVINFNTDQEYRNNEELRSAGEQVVHNPVRSIAPGKHSLKQLLNATVSQKEALEESFAKGYANRKEASGRYGW
ncbi:hypothetical protein V495_04254 [Pseudogymnoascus sp. VKM F-4514 (FW-929)]|nr:hypothetical protein V495_04254 [Pseudogymnoascus sp. VKM F-4514 (FW-929)]KFY57112.1 hypothetical protein V497_05745 [Pseudogymnoascus sp. VKM F-4516 (FW-969)]